MCGGGAGLACHSVRFPIKVATAALAAAAPPPLQLSALAQRFAQTGVKAVAGGAVGFGVYALGMAEVRRHAINNQLRNH